MWPNVKQVVGALYVSPASMFLCVIDIPFHSPSLLSMKSRGSIDLFEHCPESSIGQFCHYPPVRGR